MAGGAALAPIAFALWAPPSMSEGAMRIWLLLATISFFTAHTAVAIPLASWGADWAAASSDRTRAYGARQIGVLLGMGIGMAFVAPLLGQERIRDEAFWLALGVAAVGPLLIVSGALFLADTRVSRARDGGFDWFRTVVSNPHARTLLSVRLAAALSSAALSVLGGHVSEHIIGDASALPWLICTFVVSSAAFVPVANSLATRFGKRRVWSGALIASMVGFVGLGLTQRGNLGWALVCAAIGGAAETCSSVMGAAMQAEVVDHDELHTGQRRASTHFAAALFVHKVAHAAAAFAVGVALEAVGLSDAPDANMVTTLRVLIAVVPTLGTLATIVLLNRHRLSEAEHAEVQAALQARRA